MLAVRGQGRGEHPAGVREGADHLALREAEQGEVELVGTPSPAWLGAPLRTPAATIGVLVVQHYENEAAYTERDLEFLVSVGGQIALAIERKRAEEKIRESEARLRVLVEQLPAVLWEIAIRFRPRKKT